MKIELERTESANESITEVYMETCGLNPPEIILEKIWKT